MASKGAVSAAAGVIVAIVVVAVVAAAVVYGLNSGSGSKGAKGKATTGKTAPKPPPLIPKTALDVNGTLSKEFTFGDTQLSEAYELTTVRATGVGLKGAFKGSGVKGTFEGTGRQVKLNTSSKYKGDIAKGSINFSLSDNGYGSLSGEGSLSLQCKVTSGTATNKYGTKPINPSTSTVVIAIKVKVEGSSATVTAQGGSGSLMGTFGAAKR